MQLFSPEACGKVLHNELSRTMSCIIMEKMTVPGTTNHGKQEQHTCYMRDPFQVMRDQMPLARDHQISTMPRIWNTGDLGKKQGTSEASESRPHFMDTFFARIVFDCAGKHVIKSTEPRTVLHNHEGTEIPSFVGMVQFYTDKKTTSLKVNVSVAYPVDIVLLNCAGNYRRYLFDHGQNFLGFLAVSAAEQEKPFKLDDLGDCASVSGSDPVIQLTDQIPQTSQPNGRGVKIAILHAATQKVL